MCTGLFYILSCGEGDLQSRYQWLLFLDLCGERVFSACIFIRKEIIQAVKTTLHILMHTTLP
jgi:hypothetical protein